MSTEGPGMKIEDQDFYELMQGYRHAQLLPQDQVVKAFEAVKAWITAYADEREKERDKWWASQALFTRDEALEEAAKVAARISENYFQTFMSANYKGPGEEGAQATSAAAAKIRALKSTPAPGGAK